MTVTYPSPFFVPIAANYVPGQVVVSATHPVLHQATFVRVLGFHPDGERMRVHLPGWLYHAGHARRSFLMPIPREIRHVLYLFREGPYPLMFVALANLGAKSYRDLVFTDWNSSSIWRQFSGKPRKPQGPWPTGVGPE